MTREKKLKKIYEVIADKTLSFGCRMENETILVNINHPFALNSYVKYLDKWHNMKQYDTAGVVPTQKIIGHPVMIGDVLDWIKKDLSKTYRFNEDIKQYKNADKLREHKRKPIGDQSDDCIDFIYSLIQDD